MYRETTPKKEKKTATLEVSGAFAEFLEERKQQFPDLTEREIVEQTFKDGLWILEEDIPSGEVYIKQFVDTISLLSPHLAGEKPKETQRKIKQYRELAKKFFAIYAGVEWTKAFIGGGGFITVTDDPEDKTKKRNKEEIDRFNRTVYQDYYTRGLDKINNIMLHPALVDGIGAAEIVYETPMEFQQYATLIVQENEAGQPPTITLDREDVDWQSHGGIVRLKIIEDAIFRLTPKRHPVTYEIMYFTLDEDQTQPLPDVVKLLPEQVFVMSPNRTEYRLVGESVVAPVATLALLLDAILQAIGVNFRRWGNKRYFFITGTPERPWSPAHVHNFLKDVKKMVSKNKMGIPVPAGFDFKEIGGEIFEGGDVINYFFSAISTGMLFPRDFMETGRTQASDKNWRAWLVRIIKLQRDIRRDIEQQLWEKHLWCKYGRQHRISKKGQRIENQEMVSQYVPKLSWKAEGRLLYIQERIEILTRILAASPNDPISPALKLAIEKDIADTLGYGEIPFPTQKELEKFLEKQRQKIELKVQKPQPKGKVPPQFQKKQREQPEEEAL